MTDDESLDRLIAEACGALVEKNAAEFLCTDTSGVSVPKSLDRRIKKMINSAEAAQQTAGADEAATADTDIRLYFPFGRRRIGFCKKMTIAIIAAVVTCSVTAFAVVEIFWNGSLKFFDDYIDVKYNTPEITPPTTIEKKYEPKVPEEWERKVVFDLYFDYTIKYYKDGKRMIWYSQEVIHNGGGLKIDNDNTVIEDIVINGYAAKLFTLVDKKAFIVLWSDGEYAFEIGSVSKDITREQIIEICESIK